MYKPLRQRSKARRGEGDIGISEFPEPFLNDPILDYCKRVGCLIKRMWGSSGEPIFP